MAEHHGLGDHAVHHTSATFQGFAQTTTDSDDEHIAETLCLADGVVMSRMHDVKTPVDVPVVSIQIDIPEKRKEHGDGKSMVAKSNTLKRETNAPF